MRVTRTSGVGLAIGAATLVLFGSGFGGEPMEPELQNTKTDDRTAGLMQRKLTGSQAVLAGLLKGDLNQVGTAAADLHEIARTPTPDREDDAVYRHFNVEFQRLTEKLQRVAAGGNVDAATYVHGQLTSTCISCHQHVRDVKPIGGE